VLVAVQSRNQLAVIDPRGQQIVRRVGLAGCDHDHGLLVDAPHRLAFATCDGNARLLLVDIDQMRVTAAYRVGRSPDALAFDLGLGRLYVGSESGTVTVFAERAGRLVRLGAGVSRTRTRSPLIRVRTWSTCRWSGRPAARCCASWHPPQGPGVRGDRQRSRHARHAVAESGLRSPR